MILVKLLRDCPQQCGFAGEQMGLADEVALKLIAAGKAERWVEEAPVVPLATSPQPVEFGDVVEFEVTEVDPDALVSQSDDGQPDEGEEPAPRRRGRPRKNPA